MASGAITIRKLDHAGREVLRYPGQVVFDDGETLVARCRFAPPDTERAGFVFGHGDILIECYYRAEPFNIFVIYSPEGRLKGWYCNVLEQAAFHADAVDWLDLALDLLILPDGRQIVLDADEFEELGPTPAQRARAQGALETLRRWAAQGVFPFNLAG